MEVIVKVYNKSKYEIDREVVAKAEYNIKDFEVVDGTRAAEEIEQYTDDSGIDENHEYLVLTLANGETATFRNSYVDLFEY